MKTNTLTVTENKVLTDRGISVSLETALKVINLVRIFKNRNQTLCTTYDGIHGKDYDPVNKPCNICKWSKEFGEDFLDVDTDDRQKRHRISKITKICTNLTCPYRYNCHHTKLVVHVGCHLISEEELFRIEPEVTRLISENKE